jgi:hypothetical protein
MSVKLVVQSYDGTKQRVSEDNPIPVTQVYGGANSKDWQIRMYRDLAPNDNDKLITIPPKHQWQILSIYVIYVASGDAGTRQLQIDFRDQTGVAFFEQRPNATQAVSETRNYSIGPSMANLTAFYDTNHLQTPIPPTLFLDAQWSIRFFDNNDITMNDDLDIFILYADREV